MRLPELTELFPHYSPGFEYAVLISSSLNQWHICPAPDLTLAYLKVPDLSVLRLPTDSSGC